MVDSAVQLDLFGDSEDHDDRLYELYEKTANREFKSHVQFIKAGSINEAEDKISEVNPEYWRSKSVRAVNMDYVWKTFEQIQFSYKVCKSILGIEDIIND